MLAQSSATGFTATPFSDSQPYERYDDLDRRMRYIQSAFAASRAYAQPQYVIRQLIGVKQTEITDGHRYALHATNVMLSISQHGSNGHARGADAHGFTSSIAILLHCNGLLMSVRRCVAPAEQRSDCASGDGAHQCSRTSLVDVVQIGT
jgi:hypothetical protein